MKAFHDDEKIKRKYLARVKAHREADEIAKGHYWEGGKGCAVGCTIHSGDHKQYEIELGIPEWLARVEDAIFEGLPNERAKFWPEQFLEAIPVGADLDKIKIPFLLCVLEKNSSTLKVLKGLTEGGSFVDVIEGVEMANFGVINAIALGPQKDLVSAADVADAAGTAYAAARVACAAAYCAARAADDAAGAADAAYCAARVACASYAAYYAAGGADGADSARAAARAAYYAAHATADVADGAHVAAYESLADKLLELLKGACYEKGKRAGDGYYDR